MYRAGGAKDPAQRNKKELLIGKSWTYLYNNFHKFSQDNKIKIALELSKKDMPTKLEGDKALVPQMPPAINFISVRIENKIDDKSVEHRDSGELLSNTEARIPV
jgi:hypothetical protein